MPCKDCDRNQHMWDVVVNEHQYVPKPGDMVLDLGMWHGHFTIYCASRGAFVKGYEPIPEVFSEFEQYLKKESFVDSVNPVNKAVWSSDGKVAFNIDQRNERSSAVGGGNLIVPCESLAAAMEDVAWECVKVDIEGAEHEVFTKCDATLFERIGFLTMEIHNDVLTQEQHDELVSRIVKGFGKTKLVEQYAHGKPLGRICKVFAWREK